MIDTIEYEKKNNGELYKRTNGCRMLPFFLFALPLSVGCMIAISSYDKYIKESFKSAYLGEDKINSGLWALASSLYPLGGCGGTFLFVTISNDVGERITTIISILCGFIGSSLYVISYFTSSFSFFCFSRLIFGLSSGGIMAVGIVYFYDLVIPKMHFVLSVSIQLLINLGLLVSGVFSLENLIQTKWYITTMPLFSLQIFTLLVVSYLPSSPLRVFSLTKSVEKTKKVLRRIRNGSERDIDSEANSIYETFTKNDSAEQKIGLLYLLREVKFRNPLFITCLCAIFQQFSGINVTILYATDIVSKADFTKLDLGNLILFGDCVLGSIIFAFILPRFGSKTMLILGHFMMAVSYFMAFGLNMSKAIPSWVTVFLLSQFLFWFQAGPGPKPWSIFSETFEPQYRKAAQGLLSLSNWFFNFVLTLAYPFIGERMGFYPILMFAVLNLFFALFFFGFMVETKNKTPEQIRLEYKNKRLRFF